MATKKGNGRDMKRRPGVSGSAREVAVNEMKGLVLKDLGAGDGNLSAGKSQQLPPHQKYLFFT